MVAGTTGDGVDKVGGGGNEAAGFEAVDVGAVLDPTEAGRDGCVGCMTAVGTLGTAVAPVEGEGVGSTFFPCVDVAGVDMAVVVVVVVVVSGGGGVAVLATAGTSCFDSVSTGSCFTVTVAGAATGAGFGGGGALGSKNLAGTPCAAKSPVPTHAPTSRLHL